MRRYENITFACSFKQHLINDTYLDNVNTLPRVKSRENFLGFNMSKGRNDIASPKQMVPSIVEITFTEFFKTLVLPNTSEVIKPIILCFLDKLGKFSSSFLAIQLCCSFLLLLMPGSLDTPRKGSSSSSLDPNGVFSVGSFIEDSFDVNDDRELLELLLLK